MISRSQDFGLARSKRVEDKMPVNDADDLRNPAAKAYERFEQRLGHTYVEGAAVSSHFRLAIDSANSPAGRKEGVSISMGEAKVRKLEGFEGEIKGRTVTAPLRRTEIFEGQVIAEGTRTYHAMRLGDPHYLELTVNVMRTAD
jgi:hypothetical protein